MKFILIVFLTTSCFAGFWQTESNIELFVNNTLDNWIEYKKQGHCQSKEGKICYDINAQNMAYYRLKDTLVDDTSKPIYAAFQNATDCIIKEYDPMEERDPNNCGKLTERINTGTFEDPIYSYPLCSDSTFFPRYAFKIDFPLSYPDALEDEYFAYCTKVTGYLKKTIKTFKIDTVLKEAHDLKKADKLAEKEAKEDAKALLKDKKGKIKNLSKTEVNELLEAILLHLGI